MRLAVVGNPGNRRVSLFQAAAARAGLPEPDVLPWRDVAAGVPLRLHPGSVVRIESPGEDAEVNRLLRGASTASAHGEIVGASAWYAGFGQALQHVAEAAQTQGARLLAEPAEILTMFDKAACHSRLSQAGVAVPPALPGQPGSWAELRGRLASVGWSRAFIKPRHGSSASGVIALQIASAGGNGHDGHGSRDRRVLATTSIEADGNRLFNSLRVRHYRTEREVASIVDRLAPEGLHVERWMPKADLGGCVVDLRVVVIGGTPSHVVVRASRSPMTNLHLGGARGDLAALRLAAGANYHDGLATCRAAAACFPGSHQVGVDLMFGTGWRRHAVAEVNAFGDLLPGLLVDGRDTYDAEIAEIADPREQV